MATAPFIINPSIPASSDLISQYPMPARLFREVVDDWLKVDHNTDPGGHRWVTLEEHDTAPANPPADNLRVYMADGRLYVATSAGVYRQIFTSVPVAEFDTEHDGITLADISDFVFGDGAGEVAEGNDPRIAGAVQRDGDNLEGGFTADVHNLGTVSTGTTTPTPANGNYQRMVNGGASTVAAPTLAGNYDIAIFVTNNASAGTLTFTGFARVFGDDLTTVNGDRFILNIRKLHDRVRCVVEALQE